MKKKTTYIALSAIGIFLIGCEKPPTNSTTTPGSTATAHGHDHDDHAGHDHAAHDHSAPHGGHLIELGGNHEYHAELLDDDASKSVTIYIMDGDMQPLIINQPIVRLSLTAGGQTESFEIAVNKSDGVSEFKSSDQKLWKLITTAGVTGKLRVTIDETPFSGVFEDHEH